MWKWILDTIFQQQLLITVWLYQNEILFSIYSFLSYPVSGRIILTCSNNAGLAMSLAIAKTCRSSREAFQMYLCYLLMLFYSIRAWEENAPGNCCSFGRRAIYNRPQLPPLHPKLNYQHSLLLLNQPKTGFHHILSTFKILQHRMLVVELITVGRVLRSFYKMILAQRKTKKQTKTEFNLFENRNEKKEKIHKCCPLQGWVI